MRTLVAHPRPSIDMVGWWRNIAVLTEGVIDEAGAQCLRKPAAQVRIAPTPREKTFASGRLPVS